MNYNIFEFGSLFLDNQAQFVSSFPSDGNTIAHHDGKADVVIGSTASGYGIPWVKPNGLNLFVADRVILTQVSWRSLQKNGFGDEDGQIIIIGEHRFRCRLPHICRADTHCDEWIQALNATKDSDTLWHWKQVCFWGLEAVSASNHAARGGVAARFWTLFANSAHSENIGFRPVLEILPSIVVTPNCNLDGQDFHWGALPDYSNFCPVLQPTDQEVFANVQAGQSVRMYTLLKNGKPVRTDTGRKSKFQNVSQLELTDRYYGESTSFPGPSPMGWRWRIGLCYSKYNEESRIQYGFCFIFFGHFAYNNLKE